MNFSSIRLRLPLSYALVALLAALALGSLMLLVLNSYYTRQERDYLQGNAEAARTVVEQTLQNYPAGEPLTDQVRGLAFLSQSQIRVLDAHGAVLADSGVVEPNQMVSFSSDIQGITVINVGAASPVTSIQSQVGASNGVVVIDPGVTAAPDTESSLTLQMGGSPSTALSINASPFGYGFVTGQAPQTNLRSSQVVSVPFLSRPGSLEISHGPAYGSDILRSVALAWLLASLAAVALAGLAGFFASREVTRPVLALTEAARRMQFGELTVRAGLAPGQQAREFSALAETFNAMAQRVENTVSTLRAFVSDAAHELNTPLTALRTNLELAQAEDDSAQRELYLGRAIAQNLRLERLASGLLDLSRLETASSSSDYSSLDLSGLAAEIAERFASRAEQAGRNFSLNLPSGPLNVRGNAMQIQRALDNLLENALKFTAQDGSIQLSLEKHAAQAVIRVTDDGIGIPAEDLPALFERFHRGRNAAEYPGTGLGLAIVKAIVELHGGKLEAHSAGPGRGSLLIVHLPTLQDSLAA